MFARVRVFLWVLVVLSAAGVIYLRSGDRRVVESPMVASIDKDESDGTNLQLDSTGRAFAEVPWEYLPNVDRFELIDQEGNKFDSADLAGQAYVVSFFFASCPTFCMDLNKEIDRVNSALKGTDIRFLTLTVDPKNDTPEVLNKYADGFGAKPDRWAFLTGQNYQLVEIGENMFNVPVNPETHTDNILLVDKWGRYRDRFKWDQPYDMKRFIKVAKEVAAETKPPLGEKVETRNVLAGVEREELNDIRWVRDFFLTERTGEKFFSRDLTGEVWIANFFFSNCPGVCKAQNQYLRNLQKRLGDECPRLVSITTDPARDTVEHLREFADTLEADPENWLFLTGNPVLIKRIGSEFFKADSGAEHHSSLLYVVDRWGQVRGKFDWENAADEVEMIKLVKVLEGEDRPNPRGGEIKETAKAEERE
ncbi:MAG: SCO family protein [Mariniblastus sp.]|nr:SCO family protein [Mariniblastus sp.]